MAALTRWRSRIEAGSVLSRQDSSADVLGAGSRAGSEEKELELVQGLQPRSRAPSSGVVELSPDGGASDEEMPSASRLVRGKSRTALLTRMASSAKGLFMTGRRPSFSRGGSDRLTVFMGDNVHTVQQMHFKKQKFLNPQHNSLPPGTKCVLNPTRKYVRVWDGSMILLLVIVAVLTPFEVGFLDTTLLSPLFVLNRLVDAAFLVVRGRPPARAASPPAHARSRAAGHHHQLLPALLRQGARRVRDRPPGHGGALPQVRRARAHATARPAHPTPPPPVAGRGS